MKKILLDAREMAHPEPFEIAIKHLQSMSESEYLYMLNQKVPTPLLNLVQEKGFRYHTYEEQEGTWHIIMSKNSTQNLEELVDV